MEKLVDIELKVVSDRRDGLLLALGEVLVANRFNLLRQRRANTETGVVMVLVVQGPEVNLLQLQEQLGTHWMVQSFEANPYDAAAPTAPIAPIRVDTATSSAPPSPPPVTAPASSVDNQKRVEALLPQIARDYPQIFGLTLGMERGLEPAQREATMRYVGTRVGAWVYKRDFALGAHLPLPGSIRHIALPAIRQLLPTELEEESLKTSSSPFCNPGQPATAPQCHFLRGFLEGALNEAGNLGMVRVSEVSCRAQGADCCKFVFNV
jgi:hypothetical protein